MGAGGAETVLDAWREGQQSSRLLLAGLTVAGVVRPRYCGERCQGATPSRYAAAHFRQIKSIAVSPRSTNRQAARGAHGVTGHIPNGLTTQRWITSAPDRARRTSTDAMKDTIAFLKAHGALIDPTIS